MLYQSTRTGLLDFSRNERNLGCFQFLFVVGSQFPGYPDVTQAIPAIGGYFELKGLVLREELIDGRSNFR